MLRSCLLFLCTVLLLPAADVSLVAVNGSGADVVVTMHLDSAPAFATAGALVRFDKTKLQLTAQAAGSFATFIPDTRALSEINASGEVRCGTFALADNGGGNGTLGVFTFTTIASGSAEVTSVLQSGAEPFGCALQTQAGGAVALTLVGLPIAVNSGTANAQPTIASATATPSPVIGTQATLAVSASDDGGEPALTYTWSAPTIPAGEGVTFAPNGGNAGKAAVASFTKAGAYTLRVTVSDGSLSRTRDVAVTVAQTAATVVVTPAAVSLALGGTQAFTAQTRDQFGTALAVQPAVSWSLGGGGVGAIAPDGVYTASAAGSATVRATAAALNGTASVTVGAASTPDSSGGGGGGGGCGLGTTAALVLGFGLTRLVAGRRRKG